jgi:hypothetical protein
MLKGPRKLNFGQLFSVHLFLISQLLPKLQGVLFNLENFEATELDEKN